MKCRRIRFSKNPFPSNQENAPFISKEFCCRFKFPMVLIAHGFNHG
jgi:hypothetical protein